MEKPNILYIFADQHRKFDLGCYGNKNVKTPNLDALCAEGLRFNHCISNSPVCVPARGTLLTGLFAKKHKAFTNDVAIDSSCESIADVLKTQGYHTGYLGKWHLAGIPRDKAVTKENRLGFEEWKVANCNHDYLDIYYYDENDVKHNVEGYEPEIFGELAREFIIRNKNSDDENRSKPWALYLSLATPHDPFDAIPEKYIKDIADDKVILRDNVTDKVKFRVDNYVNIEDYKKIVKGYFGHVFAIDCQIGKIIDTLKSTNQYDNTIIIYTADHGDMLGSHGEKDKQVAYEESIAIPLIAFWKDKIYSGVCDELIGLNDLPLSIAGLVGARFKTETDGENLSRLFTNKGAKSYDSAYLYDYYPCHQAELKGMQAWRGIRTKQYTYAVRADDFNFMLFDNYSDPLQLNNLVGKEKYKELQNTLFAELKKHIEKHDKLVDGISYVVYAGQQDEFNASQKHFNKTIFAPNN